MAPTGLAQAIVSRGTKRHYRPGDALFNAGDEPTSAAVVVDGLVKVFSYASNGREVLLGLRGPGDVLGELGVLDGSPRAATALACGPVEAATIARAELGQLLAEDTQLSRELMETMAVRLRDADIKRLEFAALGTLGRVASRILELAERFGDPGTTGVRIPLPLSQEELAGWCGSSRESTVKALRRLRELHLVTTGRRSVLIRDAEALERHTRPL